MNEPLLLVPGPCTVEPDVLATLGRPVPLHYGPHWTATYDRLRRQLAEVFGTAGEVHLLFGPGSAGMEMTLGSVLAPGDELVVVVEGIFGQRLVEIARTLGLVVHELRTEGTRPAGGEELAAMLGGHPAVRAVAMVHHETGTGVLTPVERLCRTARAAGLITVVDAISSLGGAPLRMDDWGVDLCVTVANKCLGGPVGVAPVAVGPRALELISAPPARRRKAVGWYLDLATWHRYQDMWSSWHPHPTTMPGNVVHALATATDRIFEVGLDAHHRRIAAAARQARGGLRALGLCTLVPDEIAAPAVTSVRAPDGMDVDHYLRWLVDKHGMLAAAGLPPHAGASFRVGHMGRAAEPGVVTDWLDATRDYLRIEGIGARS
ncbi:pyridoxal-phosphate-dependent aminotransferase family protein [Pseudonocardia acaciae]|uniref:pyridoxal-phosphate-dependent aminotransferase family protein n=1 Tax=Pseudonocardia acaciae TaxID=551276 RepID=UPI0005633C64|nr:aminotransferase class V-fold PLP-dependent enzyme [Pseudonocardia acaciae]